MAIVAAFGKPMGRCADHRGLGPRRLVGVVLALVAALPPSAALAEIGDLRPTAGRMDPNCACQTNVKPQPGGGWVLPLMRCPQDPPPDSVPFPWVRNVNTNMGHFEALEYEFRNNQHDPWQWLPLVLKETERLATGKTELEIIAKVKQEDVNKACYRLADRIKAKGELINRSKVVNPFPSGGKRLNLSERCQEFFGKTTFAHAYGTQCTVALITRERDVVLDVTGTAQVSCFVPDVAARLVPPFLSYDPAGAPQAFVGPGGYGSEARFDMFDVCTYPEWGGALPPPPPPPPPGP